jgi:hypothetical protein
MRKSVLVVMTVLTLMKMLWTSVMMMMMMKIVISAQDLCLQLKEVVGAVLLRQPPVAVGGAGVGV